MGTSPGGRVQEIGLTVVSQFTALPITPAGRVSPLGPFGISPAQLSCQFRFVEYVPFLVSDVNGRQPALPKLRRFEQGVFSSISSKRDGAAEPRGCDDICHPRLRAFH
jgi:hypothetical protein